MNTVEEAIWTWAPMVLSAPSSEEVYVSAKGAAIVRALAEAFFSDV